MNDTTTRDQLDLIFSAKAWPNTFGSKLAALLQVPRDIYVRLIKAEIELHEAAKTQRLALEEVEQWLRQRQADAQELEAKE